MNRAVFGVPALAGCALSGGRGRLKPGLRTSSWVVLDPPETVLAPARPLRDTLARLDDDSSRAAKILEDHCDLGRAAELGRLGLPFNAAQRLSQRGDAGSATRQAQLGPRAVGPITGRHATRET